uniref:Uncharacterized protein n=1 Tax=Arundo donax TaxID=35708 RepID=A0A0A9GPX5_ARUDO
MPCFIESLHFWLYDVITLFSAQKDATVRILPIASITT